MSQEPQIIEYGGDPDQAPRMTAVILLICGMLGVGFLLVNVVFTGEDPYYDQQAWEEGDEPINQRFDITPNLVRGRQTGDDSEEDDDATALAKIRTKKSAKSTTNPTRSPLGSPTLPTPATSPAFPRR